VRRSFSDFPRRQEYFRLGEKATNDRAAKVARRAGNNEVLVLE
jgi:hypothetical protein